MAAVFIFLFKVDIDHEHDKKHVDFLANDFLAFDCIINCNEFYSPGLTVRQNKNFMDSKQCLQAIIHFTILNFYM